MSEKYEKAAEKNDNTEQYVDRGIELVSSVAGLAVGLVTNSQRLLNNLPTVNYVF